MADSAEDEEIFWVEPKRRAIFLFDEMHVPRRLAKTIRQQKFRITYNQCFAEVMRGCATMPRQEGKTWINRTIHRLYNALHAKGFAHSVEVWDGDELVGGLYGIALGRAFFGESMFSRARDASKVALVSLAARLEAAGYAFMDAQFTTPHLEQFGIKEIPKKEYQGVLAFGLGRRPYRWMPSRLQSQRVPHHLALLPLPAS